MKRFLNKMPIKLLLLLLVFGAWELAYSHSANKVWVELRPNGRFRVAIDYTIPALKERREAYVEFSERAKAEAFYYDVLRGADFHLPDGGTIRFSPVPTKPRPW